MPDGEGRFLKAGDPVIFEYLAGDVTATVLALRAGSRYLIQLDPVQPRSPQEHPRLRAALDDEAALRAEMAANPEDEQEPFEVEGSCLYLVPEDGDED